MLFYLDFANVLILSCFFLFFLFIDLYFLISTVITQVFNPIADFIIPIAIPTKEAKAKMETHPVIVETAIIECSIYFKNSAKFFMLLTH